MGVGTNIFFHLERRKKKNIREQAAFMPHARGQCSHRSKPTLMVRWGKVRFVCFSFLFILSIEESLLVRIQSYNPRFLSLPALANYSLCHHLITLQVYILISFNSACRIVICWKELQFVNVSLFEFASQLIHLRHV